MKEFAPKIITKLFLLPNLLGKIFNMVNFNYVAKTSRRDVLVSSLTVFYWFSTFPILNLVFTPLSLVFI